MEYKGFPEDRRVLPRDDTFLGLPVFKTEKGTLNSREDVGNSYLEYYLGVKREEYLAYKDALAADGWQQVTHHAEPIRIVVNTSIFAKDRRILALMCFDFPESMWLPRKFFRTVALRPGYRMFDAGDLFADVPGFEDRAGGTAADGTETDAGIFSAPRDTGEGHFTAVRDGVTREGYDEYLVRLARSGWTQIQKSSIADTMFTALYEKDGRRLSALLAAPSRKLYVTVGEEADTLSPHLFDLPEWRRKIDVDAKTSLHMLELWHFGNSFVIHLKNGHFLISDGGSRCETPYLLDYLESLTGGGKPVIEGWFISHLHADHCGVLIELALDERWSSRLELDGVYISIPSAEMLALDPSGMGVAEILRLLPERIRTSAGKPVPFYRLRTGERYYFADITVDAIMTQELLPYEDCTGDLNDTSAWLIFNIEGQKVLLAGDGDKGGMKLLMDNYSPEFMRMDVMGLLHHGWNTRDFFTDYCRTRTMLFTCYGTDGPKQKAEANAHVKEMVEEYFPWSDGTRVLTFPYHVGESVCLPHFDWKYHRGEVRPCTPNVAEKRNK